MALVAAACAALGMVCWRGGLRGVTTQSRLGPVATPHTERPARAGVRLRRRRRAEAVTFAAEVGAELAAGASWDTALVRAAADGSELVLPLRASPSPQVALRRLSTLPGAEGLAALAAVGDLSLQTGASAAVLAERVAQVLRAEERARRSVDVELSSALATTRLLATLPAVGLLMGAAVGADPVRVLVFSAAGRACLLTAVVLEVAGIAWCRRIRRVALG